MSAHIYIYIYIYICVCVCVCLHHLECVFKISKFIWVQERIVMVTSKYLSAIVLPVRLNWINWFDETFFHFLKLPRNGIPRS